MARRRRAAVAAAVAATAAGLLAAFATQPASMEALMAGENRRKVALAALLGAVGVLAVALQQQQQQQQQQRQRDRGEDRETSKPMSAAGQGGAESRAAANEEEFEAAQKFASSGALGKVDNEDQLQLYAWFKQSVVGDCTTPKPSMLDFVGMAKWNAWRKVAGKSPAQARAAYLDILERLAPGWREKEPIAADTANAGAAAGGAGGEGGMAPRVSTFAMEEEKAHDDQTQAERLLTMAGRGELEALVTALKTSGHGKGDKLSSIVGDDNETLLHMACDRDDAAMVDALIELGADVEARDVDGLTPLGYALMNDHADLARHLVSQHGANLEARGDDGDPILSMCGPALSQSLRELAAGKSK